MSDELRESLSKCSDEELTRRLLAVEDYTPEAMETMRTVLKERGFTDSSINEQRKAIAARDEALVTNPDPEKDAIPTGIGGWLGVLAMGLAIMLVRNMVALFSPMDTVSLILTIVEIALALTLITTMVQRRPFFPKLAAGIIGIRAAVYSVAILMGGEIAVAIGFATPAIIGIAYLQLSKRVKATFGQNVFSVPETRPTFCTECDSPVPSDAKFCSSCGEEFDDDVEVTP